MSETKVAARYAKSLLDLALEQNKLEEVNKDINLFLEVSAKSADLVKLFRNPVVKTDRKLNIVQKVFGGKLSSLTLLFLETIIRKGREFHIVEIAEEFHKAYQRSKGIVSASVTTAVAIDEKLKQEIRASLEQQTRKQIDLTALVDPKIIGGLVIRLEDKLFDASIANKLAVIKKNLINSY